MQCADGQLQQFGKDVVLKGLGLFNSDFPGGNGIYVIIAAVTSGNGVRL